MLLSVNDIIGRRIVNVDIPDSIANRGTSTEAKYEIENFYKYLEKSIGCNSTMDNC